MSNHFASIGLVLEDEADAEELVELAAEEGDALVLPDGSLIHWSTDCGAELWLPLDRRGEIQGMEPHFESTTRMRVRLTAPVVSDPGGPPLLGGFYAWADLFTPEEAAENPQQPGLFPFVFAAPDYGLHQQRPLPYDADIQLVGFAHELTAFPDEPAFDASQDGPVRFAAESFTPTGLFMGEGDGSHPPAPPQPYAQISGIIHTAELLVNEIGGGMFYVARIQIPGGEMDIVTDTETLIGELLPGGVISGSFYLSARVYPTND